MPVILLTLSTILAAASCRAIIKDHKSRSAFDAVVQSINREPNDIDLKLAWGMIHSINKSIKRPVLFHGEFTGNINLTQTFVKSKPKYTNLLVNWIPSYTLKLYYYRCYADQYDCTQGSKITIPFRYRYYDQPRYTKTDINVCLDSNADVEWQIESNKEPIDNEYVTECKYDRCNDTYVYGTFALDCYVSPIAVGNHEFVMSRARSHQGISSAWTVLYYAGLLTGVGVGIGSCFMK
ncbi:Hypothetical protein MVR_LOCUS16 [uncultured virus]|nr:Hypothetical protein MVR_LOCUS16 [uncultured virus]